MRRLPLVAFVTLAAATIGAFFVVQHLKISTPLLAGFPAPHPPAINPVDGAVCRGVAHKSMSVSFYLLNRSDSVDVSIVNQAGTAVDTIASGVSMRASPPKRHRFVWDGRTSSGATAPDGTYYIKVALIHQGRYVLISDNSGPLPVKVLTVPPRPRVTSVAPGLISRTDHSVAKIRYTGTEGQVGRLLIYRTDLPGGLKVVKSFVAKRSGSAAWDATVAGEQPAPQGTYLVGLEVTDQACNTGIFPAENPPVAGSTRHAGVTVRDLAAQPPLTPVPAGSDATVYVDSRRHAYAWALRRAAGRHVVASGHSSAVSLRVPIGAAGLYELALRYGANRTVVPIVGGPASGSPGKVLVVVPSLTWQGVNPVDDDGDGIPNTLTAGYPVFLARPLVDGLPAGWGSLTGLVSALNKRRDSYTLSTDLGLLDGVGPVLREYTGVILAGDETWVPPTLAAALRNYVSAGGHLVSLGIDSLRRGVTVTPGRAYDPTAPRPADIFGARFGTVLPTHGAFILAGTDRLRLFTNTSGAFRSFRSYQPFSGVTPPEAIASAAGPTTRSSAILGFRLGRGTVVEVGLPGFGSALARSLDAQDIFNRLVTLLSR